MRDFFRFLNLNDRYEIFTKEECLERLSSRETFWLNMTSSLPNRIPILSKELRKSAKNRNGNYFRKFCKQAILELILSYSFRIFFFIGQNLKRVHVAYHFNNFLISFDQLYFLLEAFFHLKYYIYVEILHVTT